MSKQVLIVNPSSLLNSQPIQIIHKHPDFSHKIRSDLDPYEIIAVSYPITLANKIIPFLEPPPTCTVPTAGTRSPKRQKTASSTSRTRRNVNSDSDLDVQTNTKTTSPRKSSPSKSSISKSTTITTTFTTASTTQNLAALPTHHLTPTRQLTPPLSLTPATVNTAYTSRTISPGGTIFSPLKPLPDTWPPTLPTSVQSHIVDPSNIPPSALFTPTKLSNPTVATAKSIKPMPRSNRSRNPPLLIHFDNAATSLNHNRPLSTLCLRHDLSTQGLRDVFEWCLFSVQVGRIVDLNGWMVRFRDTGRVRGIVEVCRALALERMEVVAEILLERMECGFGMADGVM